MADGIHVETAIRYAKSGGCRWRRWRDALSEYLALYCGGNGKLRRIGGIVAVTWMWDPGGGVLCRTNVRYGGGRENEEKKNKTKQLIMTIPKRYNWQAEKQQPVLAQHALWGWESENGSPRVCGDNSELRV